MGNSLKDSLGKKYKDRFIMRKDAAQLVGVSPDTLKRWDKDGVFKAKRKPFGNIEVMVYTDTDILKLRVIASQMRPGRKTA